MMRAGIHLPVSIPVGNAAKKGRRASRSGVFPLAEIWIHAIPLLVLLCFFILWWMSRPVNVEIKDGRIVAIHPVEMPLPLINSHIDVSKNQPENGTLIQESSMLASD
ncbi:Kinase superfamily protein [Hibiscus syriacus]|uniref:Kinase superfamily protein n=1 Tax=Hibiscus syriacus TaxID=106335 RepID=A0A6A2Z7Z3_HIBSY|nr:Kinase superfamily protein [Hibiscus syriacus]